MTAKTMASRAVGVTPRGVNSGQSRDPEVDAAAAATARRLGLPGMGVMPIAAQPQTTPHPTIAFTEAAVNSALQQAGGLR